jgi:gamma-glutamyltranspeptidase
MKAHRPTIMGTRHMIAATQYLAAEAGFRILEAGGNAIDAGVACGIALGVVQPEFVNVAGGFLDAALQSEQTRMIRVRLERRAGQCSGGTCGSSVFRSKTSRACRGG